LSEDKDKKEVVKINAKPEVIASISYAKVSKQKVSWKVTLTVIIGGLIVSSFFLSGNKTRIPKKVKAMAGPKMDNNLSEQFDDGYKLADDLEASNKPKKKVYKRRKKKVIFYERPKIIESKVTPYVRIDVD